LFGGVGWLEIGKGERLVGYQRQNVGCMEGQGSVGNLMNPGKDSPFVEMLEELNENSLSLSFPT
jgi:hypothetical protein